jgi:hypothetical protein
MADPLYHTPLNPTGDEIRLLVLFPAPRDAPIRCRLETASLSSGPKYDVLTYLWAAINKSETITVNDTPFPVSKPIAAALRRLRPPSGSPRNLWIDAVCVDYQQDQQHWRLPPNIYAKARQLCVWVGEFTAGGAMGAGGLEFPHPDCDARTPPRLAFVQEAVLARRIVVMRGQDEMAWEAMGNSLGGDDEEGASPETLDFLRLYRSIKVLRQKWSDGKRDFCPYGLLYEFRWLACEDPRDRIYSSLNLAPRMLEAGLAPNYDTSVSTAHIYADFARKMIQHTGCVDILNYVRERRSLTPTPDTTTAEGAAEPSELPSWAPNWSVSDAHDPTPLLDWLDDDASPRYRAAKLMPAQIQPHPDPNTLVLNGIRFDEVVALGTPWHPETNHPPASRMGIEALEQWEALALATPVSCPYGGTDSDRRAALWRTYIGDFAGERSAPAGAAAAVLEGWYGPGIADQQRPPLRNPFHDLRGYYLRVKRSIGGDAEGVEYARRIRAACGHRRLLVSKRGYVGLAPGHAEPGDVVAVLHGGSTPFLLRPGAVPGVYSVVGECFVYGIMGGEALAWENAAAAARDFRIV